MLKAVFYRVVLSPQLWLAAAAMAVTGSFVVNYIEAQETADHTLALRQGPPPVALIQEYDPAMHRGPADEVLVVAETNLSDPVVVHLPLDGETRSAVIFPLFPVSDAGKAAIRTAVDGQGTLGAIRPVPRPVGAREVPQAMGVLFDWMPTHAAENVDVQTLLTGKYGVGQYGSVVSLNGEATNPGDMALVIRGAMAAQDLQIAETFLTVSPYVEGRVAALSPPSSSGLQKALFWSGIFFGMGGMLLTMRGMDDRRDKLARPRKPGEQDVRLSPGASVKARSRFQTIPTQDEIYAAAQARKEREAAEQRKPGVLDHGKDLVGKIRTRSQRQAGEET